MKSLNDRDRDAFQALTAAADIAKGELSSIVPRIAEARRNFARNPSDETRRDLEQIEQQAALAHGRLHDIVGRMAALLELTDDEIQIIDSAGKTGDASPRYRREELTVDQVASDGQVDDLLARSYESLLRLMPASTLEEYPAAQSGAPWRERTDGLLSIVKGVVPESEYPPIHRFAQCIGVCRALLENDPGYDMFAGASLIPQIARLADRLDLLSQIPGATKRLRSLWRGPSKDVDSTMFELLVATGCAVAGRSVEFLEPLGGKTPDLRCHDPYPLVIECKRKRVLTEYEITEERVMRELFSKLEIGARKAGMWGTFSLHLSIESKNAPIDEIVTTLLQLRFAPYSDEAVTKRWGSAAYEESARLVDIGGPTRMYSPVLLNALFAWNSDLAEWDGLVCRVGNHAESIVNIAEEPVGLLWVNSSEQAIKKRSWGPMSTLNEAIEQIPPGEFGIPFIAYQEGARSTIADMRTFNFTEWLKGCSHPANIRVPLGRIIRLYPRPLEHGAPDFIESSMSFIPDYGDDVLPGMFPSTVIVR
ncbi:hypothetical protein LGN17_21400 [Burkholderia sp. AU30280]|uniref:hypothetical protein n=1 Tax=Burkholderia sp. AU30280 TaxID=2879628 RepID=UPI001CF53057|nr:hypothetical protein [Burkholderia sp. AU30280]MCA8275045.1 hypothetical protein [Burkholderia sp. AU30280]